MVIMTQQLQNDMTINLFQDSEKSPWRPITSSQKAVNRLNKLHNSSQAKKSSVKELSFSSFCEAARVATLLNSFSWLQLVTQHHSIWLGHC